MLFRSRVKIIDRDLIECHNLQRQVLFDEEDVKKKLPKAVAAERSLKKVNSSVKVEGVVADVHYANIESLVAGADIILDGLDNLETRFLINDVSLKHKIPWVYGRAIPTSRITINIFPGETPCFRCVYPSLPPPGVIPTCDTAGVISAAPFVIGSLQSVEAIKILIGARDINRDVTSIDVWRGVFSRFKIVSRPGCPACHGEYEFLQRRFGIRTTILCGQNSVQVMDPSADGLSLKKLATHLKPRGEVGYNKFMLRFTADNHEMVVFPDGRFILKNSLDESLARALYLKYVEA